MSCTLYALNSVLQVGLKLYYYQMEKFIASDYAPFQRRFEQLFLGIKWYHLLRKHPAECQFFSTYSSSGKPEMAYHFFAGKSRSHAMSCRESFFTIICNYRKEAFACVQIHAVEYVLRSLKFNTRKSLTHNATKKVTNRPDNTMIGKTGLTSKKQQNDQLVL